MTDKYTIRDLEQAFDKMIPNSEDHGMYFGNYFNEFLFRKIVELTNRIQELENKNIEI